MFYFWQNYSLSLSCSFGLYHTFPMNIIILYTKLAGTPLEASNSQSTLFFNFRGIRKRYRIFLRRVGDSIFKVFSWEVGGIPSQNSYTAYTLTGPVRAKCNSYFQGGFFIIRSLWNIPYRKSKIIC